eukprot:5538137-Prymnesium_polylepis.1
MTIDSGKVALLKSTWLIRQRTEGGRLLPRQELDKLQRSWTASERPFFTAAELRDRLRRLGQDFGWMVRCQRVERDVTRAACLCTRHPVESEQIPVASMFGHDAR